MSSIPEAITALTDVLNDPEVSLDPEDRGDLTVALGLLWEYREPDEL
jgi:hypothetical protein